MMKVKKIKPDLASIRISGRAGSRRRSSSCEQCGANLNTARLSIWDMVAATVCDLSLLVAILAAGYFVHQWLERSPREPVWHEPLESWYF